MTDEEGDSFIEIFIETEILRLALSDLQLSAWFCMSTVVEMLNTLKI